MKQALLSILLVAFLAGCEAFSLIPDLHQKGLRATFGFGLFNPFHGIPQKIEEAEKEKGWEKTSLPENCVPDLYKEFVMYCFEKRAMCAFYEIHTGYVSGVQVGIDTDEFHDYPFDLHANGFCDWTFTQDGVQKTMMVLSQYYVGEDFLSKSPEDRVYSYDDSTILQDGLFTTGPGGAVSYFTKDETMRPSTPFTKQACVPMMGTHYYYNMTKTTECTEDSLYPWFLLVEVDGKTGSEIVVGCALMTFGTLNPVKKSRYWMENPDTMAVKMIVNNGPQCVYDLSDKFHALTVHIYFREHPRLLLC